MTMKSTAWNEDHTLRRCAACLIFKALSDFTKNKAAKDGLCAYCRPCFKISREASRAGSSPPWVEAKIPPLGEKYCSACQTFRPTSEFSRKQQSLVGQAQCKSCKRRKRKAFYAENPGKHMAHKAYQRAAGLRFKALAISGYGGVCACCGEDVFDLLSIDHIEGGGRAHKKELNRSTIFRWLVKNNYPSGFRVLCFDCNCANYNGSCGHKSVGLRYE